MRVRARATFEADKASTRMVRLPKLEMVELEIRRRFDALHLQLESYDDTAPDGLTVVNCVRDLPYDDGLDYEKERERLREDLRNMAKELGWHIRTEALSNDPERP